MNQLVAKKCQNCNQEFNIKTKDVSFFEKINVPLPTWCSACRTIRRMAFTGDRTLFKRKDSLTGEEIISIFSDSFLFPVYNYSVWWGDSWDPLDYGFKFNPKESFWLQLKKLLDSVPRYNLINLNSVGCFYCPAASFSNNSYYTIGFEADNCLYGYYGRRTKNCVDYVFMVDCENCFGSTYLRKCNNVSHSNHSEECWDSDFLYDCKNCRDCFGCIGLHNKKFYIFNKPYSEDDYRRIRKSYNLGSLEGLERAKKEFNFLSLSFPRKYARINRSYNSTGDNLKGCNNCQACFDIDSLDSSSDNCENIISATAIRDSRDVLDTGEGSELCYDSANCWGSNIKFSSMAIQSSSVQYSYNCHNSDNIFGCVGLRKKQHCILNREYSKKEYEKMIPEIIKNMNEMPFIDKKGNVYKYGEFFPYEFSAFYYNNSLAQRWFPLTKEEAENQGYRWKDPEKKDYQITKASEDLPDHIKDVDDQITKDIIECGHKGQCNH